MADENKAPLDSVVSTLSNSKPVGQQPPATPRKRSKLRAHCSRLWIVYVVSVVVVLAVFLPCLFTIIIPRVAQNMVNKARLPIYSGSLEAISNDQVIVGLKSGLDGPSGIKVRLDPFEMYLYNKETDGFYPFTSVFVPAHTIHGRTEFDIPKEAVPVLNHTELNKWLRKAVHHKETDVSVKAETTAHIGAIKTHIKIEKTTSLKGLDKLSGVKITSMDLIKPGENNGNNFRGTFSLPNSSPLSIGLGNHILNTWAGNILTGNATVTDVYLHPGDNSLPFTGKIFLNAVMSNTADIIASQKPTLAKGYMEIGISGNSTTANGEHITYLEDVLNSIMLKAHLPEHEVLGGLARSLIGPNKTMALSDVFGDLLGGFEAVDVLEIMGFDLAAWHEALEEALDGTTKMGTLMQLFDDVFV